jgi:hypothetical protein
VIIVKRTLAIVVVVAALPYLLAPVYRFPPRRPFAGTALWNPYAHLHGTWQRANLHAHGRAWNGLTNGRQSDDEVVRAYRARGYTVAGISDYHVIAANRGVQTIPIYEHGYNLAKQHQLAIGAHRVDWLDFPVWEGLNQKQYIIERVSATADLVAVSHPWSGYSPDDMRDLSGYQLMEVINGPYYGEALWDAALSAGHAVWAIGDDDTHDVTDSKRTAIAWNLIDAATPHTADVVDALRAGRSYAVSLVGTTRDARLESVELEGSTVTVRSIGVPATFVFVGEHGAVRKTVEQATEADYAIGATDPYIRTVIRTPNIVMYLNPIIRYNGIDLPSPRPSVNEAATWAQRMGIAVACLAAIAALWKRPVAGARRLA